MMWSTPQLTKLLIVGGIGFILLNGFLYCNLLTLKFGRAGRTRSSNSEDAATWTAIADGIQPPPENLTWIYVREQAKVFRTYMELAELASPGRLDIFNSRDPLDVDRAKLLKSVEAKAFPYVKAESIKGLVTNEFRKLGGLKGVKGVFFERLQRGIVITAGKKHFKLLLGLVGSLRMVFDSELPIEIWNNGVDDMSSEEKGAIIELGGYTTFRDLNEIKIWADTPWQRKGYNLKPFAMLASSFDQPMLLDADTVFLQNPSILYEDPGYTETGTLFFHDRLMGAPRSFKWMLDSVIDGRGPSKQLNASRYWNELEKEKWVNEMDSGVVLMDKRRPSVLAALMFAAWLNSRDAFERHGDFLEEHMGGDKETYWVACESLHIPYHFSPAYGSAIGSWNEKKNVTETEAILHVDDNNKPLWYNGVGFRKSKKQGHEKDWFRPDSFTLQDQKGRWRQMTSWFFPLGHSGTYVLFGGFYKEKLAQQVETAKKLEQKYKDFL